MLFPWPTRLEEQRRPCSVGLGSVVSFLSRYEKQLSWIEGGVERAGAPLPAIWSRSPKIFCSLRAILECHWQGFGH